MLSMVLHLFDPFFFLMAIVAVSLGFSKAYIVPATGVFVGVFAETLAMKVTGGHIWGESFPLLLATGIIQAILAYFAVGWWRTRKSKTNQPLKAQTV